MGMGALSPLGLDYRSTWNALVGGQSGIDRITLFDASTYPWKIAGEVKGFAPEKAIENRKLIPYLPRSVQLLVPACSMAVEESSIDGADIDPARFGVVIGASVDIFSPEQLKLDYSLEKRTDWYYRNSGKRPMLDPKDFFRNMTNIASCILAVNHGARGHNLCIHTACASGAQAIGDAYRIIQRGQADVMIAGGCDSLISFLGIAGFGLLGALSKNNDNPHKACRPFDRKRDGFVLAEGAGVVVLEELEHARSRGADIRAELLGYGASSNAYRITDMNETGPVLSMRSALTDASLKPEDMDYINAHGTSTPQNDRLETSAIKKVFGEKAFDLPVSSIKSMMGHSISAAGALELIASILTIEEGVIPPTVNYEYPDPKCDLDYVPNTSRKAEVRVALSNSFAFGGHNASLVVGKMSE